MLSIKFHYNRYRFKNRKSNKVDIYDGSQILESIPFVSALNLLLSFFNFFQGEKWKKQPSLHLLKQYLPQ